MFKFFKNKKAPIKVKCYTTPEKSLTHSYHPTVPPVPDWVKKLPTGISAFQISRNLCARFQNKFYGATSSTVRTCPGRVDLYSKGFMIPLWSDLYLFLDSEKNWRYQFADEKSSMSQHGYEEFKTMFKKDEYLHLKINSPWTINTEEDIDFLAIKPAWELKALDGLEILPGVLNFYHQFASHINMFIKFPETGEKEFLIKVGTPIYHFIPLSDRKVEVEAKILDQSDQEFINAKYSPHVSFITRDYKRHRKS